MANQRFIRTGRAEGDFIAVTEGLQPGETVVSAGAFKLRNGSAVEVNNDLAPRPERQPRRRTHEPAALGTARRGRRIGLVH